MTRPVEAYGIEIDANRAEQARTIEIETLQANTLDVRCQAESLSLLYLNPPYDWEWERVIISNSNTYSSNTHFAGSSHRNFDLCIPQQRLAKCARLLAEQFTQIQILRLTEPECLQYQQIVVLASRHKRHARLSDAALISDTRFLEAVATKSEIPALTEHADAQIRSSWFGSADLDEYRDSADEVENCCLVVGIPPSCTRSSAQTRTRERPAAHTFARRTCGTALHRRNAQWHFRRREERHIAHWRSIKFIDHWEEEEEDGTKILHDRERFSHELTLVFVNGKTQILTHEKKEEK